MKPTVVLVCLGLLGISPGVSAVTRTWTGGASSDFYDPANWSPNGTPAVGDTLNIASGTVSIAPAFTSAGQINWSGGTLVGALAISAGATMAIGGPGTPYLSCSLTNSGTITLSADLTFHGYDLYLVNLGGAIVDVAADVGISTDYGERQYIFNSGTFRKSGGSGTSTVKYLPFQNIGAIQAQSGTIQLNGGGALVGACTASPGAAIRFNSGAFSLDPGATFGGGGFIGVASGGAPSFTGTLASSMGWSGGAISGAWTIAGAGQLAASGPDTKNLQCSLTNSGTITLSGGLNFHGWDLYLVNQGGALIDLQSDLTIGTDYGGRQGILNSGTFRKSGGTGTLTLSIPLINSGWLDIPSGTLTLDTSLAMNGGSIQSTLLTTSGSSLSGTLVGTVNWTSGSLFGGFTVATNATLAIHGVGTQYLQCSLTNAGTLRLANALVFHGYDLYLVNQAGALVDVQADVGMTSDYGDRRYILNSGTFRKSSGSGVCPISSIFFQNTGTLQVQGGTVDLQSGGTLAGACTAQSGTGIIYSGGTFNLDTNAAFGGGGFIGVAGGAPTFSGTLATLMRWTNGWISGAWSIAPTGSLVVGGTGTDYFQGSLTNSGTITLSNSLTFHGWDLYLVNLSGALIDLQADVGISNEYGDRQYILNSGMFRKSASTGTSAISSIPFQNTGAIQVQSGILQLNAGGEVAGTCTVSPGAALQFNNGAFHLEPGAVFGGGGFVGVASGGTPTLTGTLSSSMSWTGGAINGSWSIAASGHLTVSGPEPKNLQCSLTNSGIITLTGSLNFHGWDLYLVNQTGGLLDVAADGAISTDYGDRQDILNSGTIRKSGGTGTLTLGVPLVNSGLVDIQNGTLTLNAPLAMSGGTIQGTVLPTGGNSLSGTLIGTVIWTNGIINGGFAVASNGTLVLSGESKSLQGNLTNSGTIMLSSGLAFHGWDLYLVNLAGGLVDVQVDIGISTDYGERQYFLNSGTFRKSGGSNTTPISGISFQNSGSVESQRGIVSFDAGFSNTGGGLTVRLNSDVDCGRITWSSPLTLNGPFGVSLLSGYTPSPSNTFQVLTFPSATGAFTSYNGLELGGGLKLTQNLGSNGLSLTVVGSPVPTAPAIQAQPLGQTVTVGANVSFSVVATGTLPLSYQWLFNQSALAGQTGATLTLANVQLSQAGDYSVVISNPAGTLLSSNALLAVNPISSGCVPEPAGLAAWWRGEGNATDSAGTNNGTLHGATFVMGEVGQAFSLNGVDQYVDTGLDAGPAALPSTTWETWVYPTRVNAGRQQILSGDDGGYDRSLLIQDDFFAAFTGSGVFVFPRSIVATNTWQHLAVIFSPTNVEMWVNGVYAAFGSAPTFDGSGNPLQIGRNPGFGEYFQGLIDEPSIYNRALSPTEIAALYAAGSAGKCTVGPVTQPGLRADYRFQNNLLSSVGNPPALTNLGNNGFANATVEGVPQTVLAFGFNDGLLLQAGASVIASNVYSIVIRAEFDDVSYYRRLLGFEATPVDDGWFVHNGRLSYWPVGDGSSIAIRAGQFVQIVVTRAADGMVRGYVDGALQIQFSDSAGKVGPGTGGVLRFFQDNTADASAGQVARIRIYDEALTEAQVAALDRLPTTPRPTLTITQVGNNVTAAWPTNFTGYRLLSAPLLTPPISWTPISNVSASGGVFQATVGVTNNGRFFQLVNP